MADLLRCIVKDKESKPCGYETVRSGMANHIRIKHPGEYKANNEFIDGLVERIGFITCAENRERRAYLAKRDNR
jgi:hypothetical protein